MKLIDAVGFVLNVAGLVLPPAVWFLKERFILWWYSSIGSKKSLKSRTIPILKKRSCPFHDERNIGTYCDVKVKWFVDLLSSVGNLRDRRILDRCMTRWIKLAILKNKGRMRTVDRIAVPKLGNVILADIVASRFHIPLVVVRQQSEHYIMPEAYFEGTVTPGERILLVDDVASDAEFIMRSIDKLKKAGADILGVVCLVERAEGRCAKRFEEAGIVFAPLHILSDDDIAALMRQY